MFDQLIFCMNVVDIDPYKMNSLDNLIRPLEIYNLHLHHVKIPKENIDLVRCEYFSSLFMNCTGYR